LGHLHGDPNTAWTDFDASVNSDANAVRVTIKRATGSAYGPVTNILAGILGYNTSEVSATATTYETFTLTSTFQRTSATPTLPLALPYQTLMNAGNRDKSSWWAHLLGPGEAIAAPADTLTKTFKDQNTGNLDSTRVQMVGNSSGDFPDNTIRRIVKAGGITVSSSNPKYFGSDSYQVTSSLSMPSAKKGDTWYAGSEYAWKTNLTAIFDAFRQAYNKKKDSNGKWAVKLPVYIPVGYSANPTKPWLLRVAKLFSFGPTPAYACKVWTPDITIEGTVPATVDEVNYNPNCTTDCNTSNNLKITVTATPDIKLVK
jgi:hypothetical protein